MAELTTVVEFKGEKLPLSHIKDQFTPEQLKAYILEKHVFISDIFLFAGFELVNKENREVWERLWDDFGGEVYPIIDDNQVIHLIGREGNDHFSYMETYEEYLKKAI